MNIDHIVNSVLAFYGGDPVVAWLLTVALFSVEAAIVMFARQRYRDRQQRIADEQFRLKMRAVIQAPEPIQWPRPAGHKQPWRNRSKAS